MADRQSSAGTEFMPMTERLLHEAEMLLLLRREVLRSGNQAEFARRNGINRSNLNRALNGEKRPGAQILKALKLKKVRPVSTATLLDLIQHEIHQTGSQSEWARRVGLHRVLVNQVLSGRRLPPSSV